MKANYTPSSRVYSNKDITEANTIVKHYHASMEVVAAAEFKEAVIRETAESVAEELTEETLLLIEDLCLDHRSLGSAADKLKHFLANELSSQDISDSKNNQEWIASRGSDLAMAITTFWISLDKNPSERRLKCRKLIQEFKDNYGSPQLEKTGLIFSRFFIEKKGTIRLLQYINSLDDSPIEKSRKVEEDESKKSKAMPIYDSAKSEQSYQKYH